MYVISNRPPAYDEYSTERPLWDSGDMGRQQQHPQWDSSDMGRQQQHPQWDSGDMERQQQRPQWDSSDMGRQQQQPSGTAVTWRDNSSAPSGTTVTWRDNSSTAREHSTQMPGDCNTRHAKTKTNSAVFQLMRQTSGKWKCKLPAKGDVMFRGQGAVRTCRVSMPQIISSQGRCYGSGTRGSKNLSGFNAPDNLKPRRLTRQNDRHVCHSRGEVREVNVCHSRGEVREVNVCQSRGEVRKVNVSGISDTTHAVERNGLHRRPQQSGRDRLPLSLPFSTQH